ncbi:hypothetical protein [Apibacter muscae]|uniref:hypothetical protein n=1 Tax=Apibacter muscae TaxID=2509004 RepID=UPI001FE83813|nr:hypothetical protein [Apibacter muscae]
MFTSGRFCQIFQVLSYSNSPSKAGQGRGTTWFSNGCLKATTPSASWGTKNKS